jgi:hypothetical protein
MASGRIKRTMRSLFISEEREEGVLIGPAVAVPADLVEVRRKIKTGLDQIKRGEGIPGEDVEADLKRMSAELRSRGDRTPNSGK